MLDKALKLFKIDMGITHNKRDEYYLSLIESSQKELERKGIYLKEESIDDVILLVDYSLWAYRKRQEDVPISNNLQIRIKNRIVLERSKEDGDS